MKVFVERVFKGRYHEVILYNHDKTMCTNVLTVLSPMKGEIRLLVTEAEKIFNHPSRLYVGE